MDFRGIWCHIGKPIMSTFTGRSYGGLGTANPPRLGFVQKRLTKPSFCYGGGSWKRTSGLLHEVAFFDHKTGNGLDHCVG
jgi:hypothetical protein